MVIKGLLQKFGITAVIAADGERTVQAYLDAKGDFDLVLMDFEMPRMDGYAATQAIRDAEVRHRWKSTPVIGLSAHAMAEYHDRAMRSGMNDCLTKPIKTERLQKILADLKKDDQAGGAFCRH